MSNEGLLVVENLAVRYPNGALGISDVSLGVRTPTIVSLLGPNGAGKTTTVRALSGFLRREGARVVGGNIMLAGTNITNWEPHRIARAGIAVVPERHKIYPRLTVREHLRGSGLHRARHERREAMEFALHLFPILKKRDRQPAGRLSGGERQMLAIARALSSVPRLLIIDEMSLGLHPSVTKAILEGVAEIKSRGVSALIADESLRWSDITEDARFELHAGRSHAVEVVLDEPLPGSANPRLDEDPQRDAGHHDGRRAGRQRGKPTAQRRAGARTIETASLRVESMSVQFGGIQALSDVTFAAQPREIVGIVGPNGAGKSTLLNAICGVVPKTGRVFLRGRDISSFRPTTVAGSGIGRSFQDPQLLQQETVLENVLCGGHLTAGYGLVTELLRRRRCRRLEGDLVSKAYELLAAAGLEAQAHKRMAELPYGTAKIVDILRAALSEPSVLLLDEPCSGLDHAERRTMARLLRELHDRRNLTLVLVEHYLGIVEEICDTVVGLQTGRVVVCGEADVVLGSTDFETLLEGGIVGDPRTTVADIE